ncbi:hypothetical protein AB205_0058390 [Aquarana catesbeiana]|uniref:Uncharacterized protein n=1 Tax=Aquarana catesbeiana TaxID=8400 RepID=A0A2G9RD53_AQUCT|nr:hypothetical protein AB205_0058390 [Aquarana catesbeiana]
MMKALKRSVGHFVTLVASSGTLPAVWDIQTSTWNQGLDSRRGEVQIPTTMEEEFRRRLRELQIQHRGPVSEQVLLGWFDSTRCELWKEALAHEQRHQGKVLPFIQERYWTQYGLRVLFLGEKPHKEQTAELSRLIWAEMRLGESYRALQWHVSQASPWIADDSPTEGFGYGGLGLLYVKLTGDPNSGSDLEWRLDEIMDFREGLLNTSEVHWALEDIEFLAIQEWELEIAYRRLLDSAQSQGWAPFAWDYQEIPVDNSEILTEEIAVENLEIAIPKAEVLTTGQSSANLCPAPIASSGFHGQVMVNLYPQTPVAETGDLIDFSAGEEQPDEPPAEELVSGPNFTVLCPAPTAVSLEFQGTSPAEALVTGQRVQDLCPSSGGSG